MKLIKKILFKVLPENTYLKLLHRSFYILYDLRFLNYDKRITNQEKVIKEQKVEIEELQKRLNDMLTNNMNKGSDLVFEIKEAIPVKDKPVDNDIRQVVMEAITEEENKRKENEEVAVQ